MFNTLHNYFRVDPQEGDNAEDLQDPSETSDSATDSEATDDSGSGLIHNMRRFGRYFEREGDTPRFITSLLNTNVGSFFVSSESEELEGMEWQNPQRIISRPPLVHKTRTVRCEVNLRKETLSMVPLQNEDGTPSDLYELHFLFDCVVDCTVTIFFVGCEKRDSEVVRYVSQKELPPLQFSAGTEQEFTAPETHLLDTSQFTEEQLQSNPKLCSYPVIIVLTPVSSCSTITSQTTFASLLKCTDGTFAVKCDKVKIQYHNTTYIVHDIFGLSTKDQTGDECVVCMSENRTTVVLPCRHLCLCKACAELLRYQSNKCPICRSAYASLLRIQHPKIEDLVVDEVGSDQPLVNKKKKKKKKKKKEGVSEV